MSCCITEKGGLEQLRAASLSNDLCVERDVVVTQARWQWKGVVIFCLKFRFCLTLVWVLVSNAKLSLVPAGYITYLPSSPVGCKREVCGLSITGIRIWPLNGFIKLWESDSVAKMRQYKVIPLNTLLHLKAEEGLCVGNPILTKIGKGMANIPSLVLFRCFRVMNVINVCRKFCSTICRLIFVNPCSYGHNGVQD